LYLLNFRHFPKFLILAVPLLISGPAQAWGPQGHEIVALIAMAELAPPARKEVARLLGNTAMMVHESNWADEIRDQRRNTGQWHYVDIPLAAPGYDPRRDCPGEDCVVAQIENDLRVLSNPRASDRVRAEALRFLIHFVADVHQPLHAEDHDDRGGNQVRVMIGRYRANLHRVWDSEVVDALGSDAGSTADAIERSITPAQRRSWSSGTPAQWANEAHAIARDRIYPPLGGRREVRLPRDYPRAQAPVTRLLLAKAGVRLAFLLNRALK
jgi:hypothetical protein